MSPGTARTAHGDGRGCASTTRSGQIEAVVIESVTRPVSPLPTWLKVGAGDDMAFIGAEACRQGMLVACDQVVEGRHFTRDTPLALIGRKAVARNISDVAAMAAQPLATLAACVIPRRIGPDGAQALLESVRRHAEHWGAPLIGGDTAVHELDSSPLTLSVTVLAVPRAGGAVPARIITRSGVAAGDRLFVTGSLGGSLGPDGLGRHLHFEPRIAASHALADALGDGLHAMMDVSDGLGIDAGRLAAAALTPVAALIDVARIPCARGASVEAALGDGEDHELIFAAAPSAVVPESLPDGRGGSIAVTCIGQIVPRMPALASATAIADWPHGRGLTDVSVRGWLHG